MWVVHATLALAGSSLSKGEPYKTPGNSAPFQAASKSNYIPLEKSKLKLCKASNVPSQKGPDQNIPRKEST